MLRIILVVPFLCLSCARSTFLKLQTAANAHLFSHMPESDDLLHFLSVCRVHLIYFCVLNYFCRQLMIHGSSHFITKLQHEFFLLISIVLFHLVLTILVV